MDQVIIELQVKFRNYAFFYRKPISILLEIKHHSSNKVQSTIAGYFSNES